MKIKLPDFKVFEITLKINLKLVTLELKFKPKTTKKSKRNKGNRSKKP